MAFNNHAGSTKSFDYVREHNEAVNRLDVILGRTPITTEYKAGELREVTQHDGSVLRLRKLSEDYDPTNRIAAANYLQERHAEGEIVTGLLYVDPDATDLHDRLGTTATPLNQLGGAALTPGAAALAKINAGLR